MSSGAVDLFNRLLRDPAHHLPHYVGRVEIGSFYSALTADREETLTMKML